MKKKAIYPGSFDPITFGHLDIIKRASAVFDEVIIAIFDNQAKKSLFTFQERKNLILSIFEDVPNISVDMFRGLLVDYAKKNSINTVIRGLRAVSDFDYEFQMALTNRQLGKDIDTLFLMTDEKFSYLSSSIVKQVCKYGGDVSSFVPKKIENALKEKLL